MWYATKEQLPEDGEQVLIRANGDYFVSTFRKGISKAERAELARLGDECPTVRCYGGDGFPSDVPRYRMFCGADEHENNRVAYNWTGPGPFSFFGQDVDYWMYIIEPETR